MQMMWVTKPRGQSWGGDYFQKILMELVSPFLQDPQNVLDVTQVIFLYDKSPFMKVLRTQNLLKDDNIDFFGNEEWPGNSPEQNACENVESILKDEDENRMQSQPLATRPHHCCASGNGDQHRAFRVTFAFLPCSSSSCLWVYACEHRTTIKCATYWCFHFFHYQAYFTLGRGGVGGGVAAAIIVWHTVYFTVHLQRSQNRCS